jgi:transcriptional regulator with GAF, ATPase, and Fis domain
MINLMLSEKTALITNDALSDERFGRGGSPAQSIEKGKIRSAVCVPLRWDGRINGVLYLDSSQREGLFSCRDLNLLSAIAQDVSSQLALGSLYRNVREENVRLQMSSGDELVGVSKKARDLRKTIGKLRDTNATVLITGETGTGKDVVAKAIHLASQRRGRPFIPVNCAAIPENLLESELFGVIAKYPGLHNDQPLQGKFALANGGTLFLDEIGELPLPLQAKLLRAVEEKTIWPLGNKEGQAIDIRIVAATNRDLEAAVRENRFRADLYERLNVFNIEIPPLRERKEDIPLLAGYFLVKLRSEYGKRVIRFSNSCIEALCIQEWPRNVRQLKNSIERAVIRADGRELTPELFDVDPSAAKPTSLKDAEREHIIKVLEYSNGNREKAARILGIAKQTLYNKGKEYGLPGFEEACRV